MDDLDCAVALGVALAVDRWLGEPPARWHPVVWMGRYLDAVGRRVAPAAGVRAPLPAATFALNGDAPASRAPDAQRAQLVARHAVTLTAVVAVAALALRGWAA